MKLFEIAPMSSGKYTSKAEINSRTVECNSCGAPIKKESAYHGGSFGKYLCKTCKTKKADS